MYPGSEGLGVHLPSNRTWARPFMGEDWGKKSRGMREKMRLGFRVHFNTMDSGPHRIGTAQPQQGEGPWEWGAEAEGDTFRC